MQRFRHYVMQKDTVMQQMAILQKYMMLQKKQFLGGLRNLKTKDTLILNL